MVTDVMAKIAVIIFNFLETFIESAVKPLALAMGI